jgi:hypothetical protein
MVVLCGAAASCIKLLGRRNAVGTSVKCLESNISEVRTEVFMVVRRIIVFGIAVGINALEHRKRQRRGSAVNQESRAYMAPVAFLARKNLDNTNTVKSGVASANRV